MFTTLRAHLLTSYLLLLAFTLGGITIALFVLFSRQPAPPAQTYSTLSTLAQGLNLRDMILEFRATQTGVVVRRLPPIAQLTDFAETRNVRVLLLTFDSTQTNTVLFDSADHYQPGDEVPVTFDLSYTNPRLNQMLRGGVSQRHGSFIDLDGSKWLFSALTTPLMMRTNQGEIWMLADTNPTQSLQQTLAQFGETLALPLLQAGIIGLGIATLLAAVISRTIARPLQALSGAASAVARGDLEQRVPVTGPQEVRALAEAFNHMSAEVRATQQAQRDFMANVSHDLKTPLTSIQGYSQAVIDGTARDPRAAAEIILDESERLNRMVIELTDLARIQAGRLSMQFTRLDLAEIAGTVARKLRVVAEHKGVQLVADDLSPALMDGDGDRLVQVISNLLDNAIKYTPPNGRIHLETRTADNGVSLIVSDSGIGIPELELERVFERFYQVDKARGPSRGTGLGLAIAYEIVQAHSGHIKVASGQGGTTFTVWLPASVDDAKRSNRSTE